MDFGLTGASGLLAVLALMLVLNGCESTPASGATERSANDVIERTAEKGPVVLRARVSPKQPRLSDTIEFTVEARTELDVEITPPPLGKSVGEFLILDFRELPEKFEDGKRVKKFTWKLEAQRSGKHLIRSTGVEFEDHRANSEAKDKKVLVETEPLEVEVTSALGSETPNLADLAPAAAPVEMPRRPLSVGVWVALGVGGLAALVAVTALVRRKKNFVVPEILRSPEEIADEELKALLAENLIERGLFGEFYVKLTGLVRRYIERTTGIHAPELTTEEFLRERKTREVFSFERAERLAQFLEAADMVKYAAVEPGQRQVEESVARTKEFVGLSSALSAMPTEGARA